MDEQDSIRLRHIADAAEKAMRFAAGRTRADLDQDEMLALALARLLEIIGEAAKNVSEGTRAQFPNIPWRSIAGTRDRLIHGYFDVDLDIVWEVITRDLPALVDALRGHV